ncbi:MAG TPA: pyruvate dehydrogenase (acetyl-transferring) E1 component subunit alpha [Steroidobacteraceae bacterium]|nr:pyruvate dehydrogenase (acetyl-transferring) E1 component subunit alpha [Steroidobacteraceae bacterium]
MNTRLQPAAPAPVRKTEDSPVRTVAEFEIKHHQLLDANGRLTGPLPEFARDPAELVRMYQLMTLVRTFDTKAVNLQRTGKLGTYASCLGHEATHVGAGAAMKSEDVLVPVYREYGAQFWRGVKMSDVLLYWGGDERGSNYEVAKQDYAWCVPIGTQALHAAGAAMAFKVRGEKRCVLAFIGDGGTSQGAFYEAMNVAGARSLPVVFVIVNNKWAISVPISSQTAAATLAQKAVAAGIPGVQVDGNDTIAVRHVVGQALGLARNGGGPALIEAITYRLSDHTTADDASRYRPADEVKNAWKVEPLIRLRKYLVDTGAWSEAQEAELKAECSKRVEAAVEEYTHTGKQSTDAMFDFLFARPPRHLQEQREQARKYGSAPGTHGGSH